VSTFAKRWAYRLPGIFSIHGNGRIIEHCSHGVLEELRWYTLRGWCVDSAVERIIKNFRSIVVLSLSYLSLVAFRGSGYFSCV
jgi:hypothetical protein